MNFTGVVHCFIFLNCSTLRNIALLYSVHPFFQPAESLSGLLEPILALLGEGGVHTEQVASLLQTGNLPHIHTPIHT